MGADVPTGPNWELDLALRVNLEITHDEEVHLGHRRRVPDVLPELRPLLEQSRR